MHLRFLVGGLCSSLVLVCIGCSGGGEGAAERKPTFQVSGTVTLAGTPLPKASVLFSPTAEGQPLATGRTDDAGKYVLTTYDSHDGAVAGDFIVIVTKPAASAAAAGPPSHNDIASGAVNPATHNAKKTAADEENPVPAKYQAAATSDLKFTVKPETQVIDLKLTP